MTQPVLKVFVVSPHVGLPKYATPGSAGVDLQASISAPITLHPGERVLIPSGLRMAIPAGYEGQVRPRSGLANKHGISMVNTPGTVDSDYRNEVGVLLINHGREPFVINPGDRIAQMVIAPVTQVAVASVESADDLGDTERGLGGWGHSGVR